MIHSLFSSTQHFVWTKDTFIYVFTISIWVKLIILETSHILHTDIFNYELAPKTDNHYFL